MIAESRVEGEVDKVLMAKVPVDSNRLFDGTFDNDCQVILVEGVSGMGKTSLAYQYAHNWAEEKLSTFDAVALVRLRDLDACDLSKVDHILPQLLSLASANTIDLITKEMARLLVDKLKILILLDGWDEAPVGIRKPSFLNNLLQSISSQTRILITSRPDFSLDLHSRTNRVEILGFTTGDIHEYFEKVFKSQMLPEHEVKLACDKLTSHFQRYPVVESCCYVPLNAAILAYIFFNRDQTLPATRCELFHELILCCIVRELQSRQPDRNLEEVSLFEDLPADLKDQLHKLSVLAFEGVLQGKIIFTQSKLKSLKIFSMLGLLQSVQGFGPIGSKLVTCNFIHLAVQELLAAFYISRLEPAEHSKNFQILLKENLKSPVLQFYAGLTGLTNEGVRNLIAQSVNRDCLLPFLNCIFEAQLCDQSFCLQIVDSLESKVDLSFTSLSPMDCLSLHYFLFSIRTVVRGLTLDITYCNINDHSLGLVLGVSSQYAAISSTSSALQSVETLRVDVSTDEGIDYLTRALDLAPDNSLKTLGVDVTDLSLSQLLKALPRHRVLRELDLQWHTEKSLKTIGEHVGRSTVKRLRLLSYCEPLQIEEWVQDGKSLIDSLQYSQVNYLLINIILLDEDSESVEAHLHRSLQEAVTYVNSKRNETDLPILKFKISCV